MRAAERAARRTGGGRGAPPTLGEKLAVHYGKLIIQGELKPGERMPTATQIATEHGCTRPVAYAALRHLERTRFIVAVPGRSGLFTVADRSA